MSAIKFSCPHCGVNIETDGDCGGVEASCPNCGKKIVVPPASGGETPSLHRSKIMSQTVWTNTPFPKVGIRPIIDGRRRGVRESLEVQTMKMAESAAKLISSSLSYPDGTPVQCVIADTTIGGVYEGGISVASAFKGDICRECGARVDEAAGKAILREIAAIREEAR